MRLTLAGLLTLLFVLIRAPMCAGAVEPPNLVRNGDFAQATKGWNIREEDDPRVMPYFNTTVIDSLGNMPGDQLSHAVRLTARAQPGASFTASLWQKINVNITAKDKLQAKIWMRSATRSTMSLWINLSTYPIPTVFHKDIPLTPQWQEYEIPIEAQLDFEGTIVLCVGVLDGSGPVDVTGVRLFHYPAPPQISAPANLAPQPQLDLRLGHSGTVRSIGVSANGSLMASSGDDQALKIWDTASGWPRRSLNIDLQQSIGGVAVTPDGKMVANAAYQVVRRWDTRTGAVLPPLPAGTGVVYAVAFSPDGKLLVGAGEDRVVWLWDAHTGKLLHTFTGHNGPVSWLTFSADGKSLASAGNRLVQRGDLGLNLRELTFEESRQLKTDNGIVVTSVNLEGPADKAGLRPNDVICRLNDREISSVTEWQAALLQYKLGQQITVGLRVGYEFGHEGKEIEVPMTLKERTFIVSNEVSIWDVPTRTLRQTFPEVTGNTEAVSLSPNGKTLLTGSNLNTLYLYDTQTRELIRTFNSSGRNVYRATFSPDGKTIAGVIGITILLWDAQTGELLQQMTGHNAVIYSMAFSADGKTLASGGPDKKVCLWNPHTGQQKQSLGRDADIISVALSPDGRTLAGASSAKVVLLWDVQSGVLKGSLPHGHIVNSVAYSSDGKLLASAGWDKVIKVWDARTGALLQTIPDDTGIIRQVAFSPDNSTLASAGDGDMIKLWNPRTGALLRTLVGHRGDVMTLAFAPDGQTLLSGSQDGTLKVWNTVTGTLLKTLDGHSTAPQTMISIAFAPDGKRFVDRSSESGIRVWNAHTKTVERIIRTWGQTGCLTFSPDGKYIIGGNYRFIMVWDVQSGELLRKLGRHGGWVWSLCFLRDSNVLVGGGEDQIKLWDISDKWGKGGRELATLYALPPATATKGLTADARAISADAKAIGAAAKPISADARAVDSFNDYLVTTPEGYYMGSAAADRYVQFRLGYDSFPAESFQARYYRPDLVRQALAGQALPLMSDLKGPVPPLLSFTTTEKVVKVSGATATVTVEASDDSGIQNVAFFVNGARVDAKPIPADARPLPADAKGLTADAKTLATGSKTLTADARPITAESRPITADGRDIPVRHTMTRRYTALIPLPRDGSSIKVQAIAFDEDGLQSPRDELLFTRDTTIAVTGRLLGLCVGVSQYQDPRLKLRFADADARALSEVLNQQRGLYSTASVAALTNEQATRAGVKAALDQLLAQTTRDDTVMLLFSGHGWREQERSFYFATHEVNRSDVANTALAWQDVVGRLIKLSQKSKRVLVFLDACHSGSAATNEELIKDVLQANAGVMVLASSKGDEVSLENREWGHGAFTKALLEGISGQAAEADAKAVTLWDFATYVRRRVSKLTEGAQNPQVPFLNDFDTDAAIVTKP